ncbi:MAG: radical SAM protein [Chloroflexota bacterium]
MNVLLLDMDSTLPNLALMKLSAWHKAQYHYVVKAREIPFGEWDSIYASAVYTWSRRRMEQLEGYAALGGHGWCLDSRLPEEVERMQPDYSLYGIDYGLGYLTQGCMRRCGFCDVWRMCPRPRVVATWDHILNPLSSFVVLLDDNFLALGGHAKLFLQEAIDRGIEVCFTQGLDVRLVTPEVAQLLAGLRFWNTHHTKRQLTIAFDSLDMDRAFSRGVKFLFEAGIKPWQIQSFFLCGYNSTFAEDMERFRLIRALMLDPFCMVYRSRESGKKVAWAVDRRLHHFSRWVNRRLYKSCEFHQYRRWLKEAGRVSLSSR